VKKILGRYLLRILSSDGLRFLRRTFYELRRRLLGRPHTLHIFLRIDDPYSYLLVQVLGDFLRRFPVRAEYHTTTEMRREMYPALSLWHKNAMHDAQHLAGLYGLSFPHDFASSGRLRIEAATAALLAAEATGNYLEIASQVFADFWGGTLPRSGVVQRLHDPALLDRLEVNERLRERLGHYLDAMIYYGDEWYWGIDRLDHLERRLIELGLARNRDERVVFNRTYHDFCRVKAGSIRSPDKPLVIYWSARSPYSYLALERAVKLSEWQGVPLQIKPVLPMMMRGMFVPRTKAFYIFFDTLREAAKYGLRFGFMADPLGAGVERCYALLDYARGKGREQAYLLSFARAVYADGIRADTNRGMATIVRRCGLDWDEARRHLNARAWRAEVDRNLEEMLGFGCWGVPSFRYGEAYFWGQDRLGLIEKAIIADSSSAPALPAPECGSSGGVPLQVGGRAR
jgi:2-hydroxychromene-2-carboxylate isomerase